MFYLEPKSTKSGVLKKDGETVERIVTLIKEDPKITQKELMDKTGLTRRGVEWNLRKLKDERKIRRVGPDKGGHWEVLKEG